MFAPTSFPRFSRIERGDRADDRTWDGEEWTEPQSPQYHLPMDPSTAPPLVSRSPEIMSGALCFTGTRVPVKNLFDYLEGSSSLEDFLEDFPSVTRDRAVAVLEAARARLSADAPAA